MFTEDHMDAVFQALSHQTRRQIMDDLRANPGINVGQLANRYDVSRIAIMNHLSVLEKASLVISKRRGSSRCLYINVMPIQQIYERWSDEYSQQWSEKASFIKRASEAAVNKGGKD